VGVNVTRLNTDDADPAGGGRKLHRRHRQGPRQPREREPDAASKARRVAGAKLVLVDGHPVLYLHKGARHLLSFPAADDAAILKRAVAKLPEVAAATRSKALRIQTIDGTPARTSTMADALRDAGFVEGYADLELEVSV
jgi:hypothetical protein